MLFDETIQESHDKKKGIVNLTDDEESLATREASVNLIQAAVGRHVASRYVTNLKSISSL
jgi:hypothetical protein